MNMFYCYGQKYVINLYIKVFFQYRSFNNMVILFSCYIGAKVHTCTWNVGQMKDICSTDEMPIGAQPSVKITDN